MLWHKLLHFFSFFFWGLELDKIHRPRYKVNTLENIYSHAYALFGTNNVQLFFPLSHHVTLFHSSTHVTQLCFKISKNTLLLLIFWECFYFDPYVL